MSQSFPVSCFQLCGFVPHRKWYVTSLACQNTKQKNGCWKIVFGISLSRHCVDSKSKIKNSVFKLKFVSLSSQISLKVICNSKRKPVRESTHQKNSHNHHRPQLKPSQVYSGNIPLQGWRHKIRSSYSIRYIIHSVKPLIYKRPPKMWRLSGCLWKVVVHKKRTKGSLFLEVVRTHLLYQR